MPVQSTAPFVRSEPPSPAAATPDLTALLLVDVPVAWTDTAGRLLGANAAFEAACGQGAGAGRGQPLWGLLGLAPAPAQALQDALAAGAGTALALGPAARAGGAARLGLRPAGGLWIASLQGALPPAAPADDPAGGQQRLAELLEMTQTLGGLGVWERDLRTGAGWWDRHVWRFWGLPPHAAAPTMAEAVRAVHPEDRAALEAYFQRSLRQVGDYAWSYRLQGADGVLRHMRSRWQVRPGADGRPARALGLEVDETETRRLAQSVDAAQAQLGLAVTLADIAVWRHDADSGRVFVSAAGWTLLGWTPRPEGVPLSELLALLHPDDLPQALAQPLPPPGEDRADGPVDFGLRVRDRRGAWRYLMTRRVPRRGPGGELLGHVGVALDLTERFEAQRHALDLAQRLEMATAAAGVGIWTVVLDGPPEMLWDHQMRRLHGLGDDEPTPRLGEYVQRFVHPDDRQAVVDATALLRQRRDGLVDLDVRIVWADGQRRRLATRSSVGSVGGRQRLHGVMLDVTERYLAEDRLREAHERSALVTHSVGIGTWASDSAAELGWWDAQMFHLRGRPPRSAPVTLDEMLAWLHPDDRERHQRQLQHALRADAPTNTEFRVVWPDGTVRWLASRSVPVRDDSGRTVRRIGINWDVTDARHAATARAEQLLAQRESQAKSRFLARISHELRTPLNAVLGFSQLLLSEQGDDGPPDAQTWRRRVAQVQASGEHLLALIDDVLELSSLESGELPMALQPVALGPLAAQALALVELPAREAGVTLHTTALDGWVQADPLRLRQVLLNLLSNAIKYNRRGGRVTLSAQAQGGWTVLQVHDTGRGLDEAQLQRLFEPFNRLGAEREGIAGTGIGLAIVRAAVQQMGGTVQVRSRPGEGSCFEVGLQQAAAPAPAPPGFAAGAPLPPAPRGGSADGSADVLYIEDNPVNLLIVRELMGRRGDLRFVEAEDGASGLAAARSRRPTLILLDMQLPDMDGHAVLQRLRADPATAQLRCIALSANAMPEDIRRARAAGFDDYWTKPLDLRGFMAALETIFGPPPA